MLGTAVPTERHRTASAKLLGIQLLQRALRVSIWSWTKDAHGRTKTKKAGFQEPRLAHTISLDIKLEMQLRYLRVPQDQATLLCSPSRAKDSRNCSWFLDLHCCTELGPRLVDKLFVHAGRRPFPNSLSCWAVANVAVYANWEVPT